LYCFFFPGDWLPAPIRGAANRKAAAVAKLQGSPVKVKTTDSPASAKKKAVLKEVQNKEPVAVTTVVTKEEVAQKKSKEAPSKEELVLEEVEAGKVEAEVAAVVEVETNKKNTTLNKAEVVKKVEEGTGGAPDSPGTFSPSN